MTFLTFREIRDYIISRIRTRIGENMNLSDNEPAGQIVGIAQDINSNTQDATIDAYNANTIFAQEDQDIDVQLIRQNKRRKKATYARIYDFKVVLDGVCSITTENLRVQNANGFQFKPVEDYTFTAGTERIDLIAVETGSVEISEGDVDEIVTPLSGLDSVENDATSVFQDGTDKETNEEARERMNSEASSELYTKDAIRRGLEDEDETTKEFVTKATPIYDDDNNEVEVVVDQSDTSESAKTAVARVIAFTKAGGIKAVSSASGSNKISRTIEIGDKSEIDIEYSLPTDKNVYARLTLVPELDGSEETALSEYLEQWVEDNQETGEDLIRNGSVSINSAINDWSGKVFTEVKVELSENGSSWAEDNISATALQKIKLPNANVSYT